MMAPYEFDFTAENFSFTAEKFDISKLCLLYCWSLTNIAKFQVDF
jgi:hypothetical protein